jgi:hypothetical protein
MRTAILMVILILALGITAYRHWQPRTANAGAANITALPVASSPTRPDFETQIKPIFQSRCLPCHFPGGKVYDKMPFDKPETITRLGEKLFTRLKDEKEQRLVREFLASR